MANGQFVKGHPGGPGRPKQKPFLDWCQKWTIERAEKFLAPIAENPKNKSQLEAIKLIMGYGVGKPVEFTEQFNYNEEVNGSDAELLARAEEIKRRIIESGTGQDKPGDGSAPTV